MSLAFIPAMLKTAFSAIQSFGPAIQAATSVASATTGFLSAQGQAAAMEQANAEANDRARLNLIEDYDQVGKMAQQERAAAAQRQEENHITAVKQRASAKVAAGEANVSGLSVDALLGDLYGQEARNRDAINQNLEGTIDQLTMEGRGLQRNTANQMATRPAVQRPSLFGAALDATTGVLDAYRHQFRVRS